MNDQVYGPITKAVSTANALGALGVTAVWALFCLVLISYIIWSLKQARDSDKQWQDIRLGEAKADATVAEALSRMADKVSQLQMIILTQKIGGKDATKMD